MRGTMLYEGRAACDGQVMPERCAACWLQAKGLPPAVARPLARLPQSLVPLARLPRLGPAVAARALAAQRLRNLQDMFAAAERVIAVCSWLRDALLANGVAPEKIVLNRQGVDDSLKLNTWVRKSSDVLRFGFLGRWDAMKGVHVLVEALKRIPKSLPVKLDVCAVGAEERSKRYREEVQVSAVGETRIRFLSGTQADGIGQFFAGIDVLAVPSQLLETGPLVVLEAFAARKPVIGSNLGGIKELVSHERNGLLVPYDDVTAWTAAMVRLASDRGLVERLRQGIGPVRTMSDVASEMATLYRELVAMRTYAA
jgi:glycosyltransferase involved in cell wall biosynthesis